MHSTTRNASTVSLMNLLIFMEHLLCQTLEKVTEQNRYVPVLTVLKYGYFKLSLPDERRGNKVLLRITKAGGSGLRCTDERSRRHERYRVNCFSWVLIGTRISLRGGIKREKGSKGIFTWSQAKLSSVLTLTQSHTVAQVKT